MTENHQSKLNISPSQSQLQSLSTNLKCKTSCATTVSTSSSQKYDIISASEAQDILKGSSKPCVPTTSVKSILPHAPSVKIPIHPNPRLIPTTFKTNSNISFSNQSFSMKTANKQKLSDVQTESVLTISQSKSTFSKQLNPKMAPSMIEAIPLYEVQSLPKVLKTHKSLFNEKKNTAEINDASYEGTTLINEKSIPSKELSISKHDKNIDKDFVDSQSDMNKLSQVIVSNYQIISPSNMYETSSQQLQVTPTQVEAIKVADVSNDNNSIYLLVTEDQTTSTNKCLVDGISSFSNDELKTIDPNSTQTLQVLNSEGIPIQISVSDLLATLNESKSNVENSEGVTSNLITASSLSSTISSTDCNSQVSQYYITNPTVGLLTDLPSWALTLRDCVLHGDTYSGYVMNETEMDIVLNLYKKETQSIFAIRQTPSPAKDERMETIRLMWKSQYVPYDGIPFVNVGRRATVMECEHGPRKRKNAIKRLIQVYGKNTTMKRITNLTCPVRLFVKKVRKFPQFKVPVLKETDQKFLRNMQEHSLKLVRSAGYESGEVRLYMQLPLPSAHRYHHIGNSVDAFERELEENKEFVLEEISVDERVLTQIQKLVRQGFTNPFIVRAAMKDFVDNKLEMNEDEERPLKHNKKFYPPMIEIQNIIQQTKVAMTNGILTPLSPPSEPLLPVKLKRKRLPDNTSFTNVIDATEIRVEPKLKSSRKSSKPSKYNVASLESLDDLSDNTTSSLNGVNDSIDNVTSSQTDNESLSVSISENNLDSLSVNNLPYDQLQQLAKIGLLALNNASKEDSNSMTSNNSSSGENENSSSAELNCTKEINIQEPKEIEDSTIVKTISAIGNESKEHVTKLHSIE